MPKIIYQIFESLLKSTSSQGKYYNKHVHTVMSPYTNNLIINSEIPDLIEGFYPINILENVNLDAKTEQTCVVEVKGTSKCEFGQTFFLMCICGVQFLPTKLKFKLSRIRFSYSGKGSS